MESFTKNVLFRKKNNKVLFRKKNYKKIEKSNFKNNRMGCGATWVSLQGWGGRGKLGFPTNKLENSHNLDKNY